MFATGKDQLPIIQIGTNSTRWFVFLDRPTLAKKGAGKEAKLCYSANALMENRNMLLLDFQVEPADGSAERRAPIALADERLPGGHRHRDDQ